MARTKAQPVAGSPDAVVIGAPVSQVEVSELDRSKEIAKRRIESGDRRPTMTQVPLKRQSEPMVTRWANTSITGRAYELVDEKGWIAVRFDELKNPGNGEFKRTPEGLVSRGVNGHQVLYKIPQGVYKEIARSKASRLHKQLGSKSKMAAGATEEAAKGNSIGSERAARAVENFGINEFEATKSRESSSFEDA